MATSNESEAYNFGKDNKLHIISILIKINNVRGTVIWLRAILNPVYFDQPQT